MRKLVLLLVVFSLVWGAADVQAQRRGGGGGSGDIMDHKVEIIPYYGWMWTWSRDVVAPIRGVGEIDIKDSSVWGVEIDVNVRPGAQLALLYSRQDSELLFRQGPLEEKVSDLAVEYYHIGGVGGHKQGKVMGFGQFTLGATRYNFKDTNISDDWRFSVIPALGAKIYASERIGIRLQGRLPITFFSGGAGFGCGSGGCSTFIGGSGITQLDVNAGLMIML